MCYVNGQAFYRREPLVFTPQDLDPFTCTHVIYAFASIEPHTYRVEPRDEEFDVIQGGYRSVTGLKRTNPNLKVNITSFFFAKILLIIFFHLRFLFLLVVKAHIVLVI